MRFAIVNLGCKVNRVESDAFAAALMARGGVPAAEEEADLVVVNTCTVTGEAEKKTRKAVRHALRANPTARVVVTGCAAALDADAFSSMDLRVEVVPKGELAAAAPNDAALRAGEGFRTRVGVKVQDGCDNACTYCIVHVARGRATSRPADGVAAEVRALVAAGVREVVLTGINLGSYDDEGLRLAGLLERLLDETRGLGPRSGGPDARFRVSSVEPMDVDDAFVSLLASAEGRVCRHLHLPLQSGSTRVLSEMARPYTAERFCELVDGLYAAVPELSLSTDVIAGFPGETEDDFAMTLEAVRRCRFAKIHAFPYSIRTGTPAAARCDQVPAPVKAERARRLRETGRALRSQELARRAGTRELAVVEPGGTALTESYFELPAPEGAPAGSLVEVTFPRG
ncbi:MiaB/RimO family radical SAM methylthiotransferase [Gordonibacter massiliensis (ex Traore et al. 2017)]|uniref:MiaB/RimO family radical SAM methylthiotransferase n=1 Tax=Gordonibacter massiliensis (ex Traore et al. 2017) TaxID=1841863 RepID=UPI001C8C4D74|nr:radical SAM protein [Gordonibacter massiliensis (ex Traore et al. 2017)]MBX9034753.1 radical SAM protein [Gordonibacter massiliensis (ex Traore et al. 2017)]